MLVQEKVKNTNSKITLLNAREQEGKKCLILPLKMFKTSRDMANTSQKGNNL